MHGGASKDELTNENLEALKKGVVNLERHINNVRKFGLPVAVAVNHFVTDTEKEVNFLMDFCKNLGVHISLCTHWSNGGEGTKEIASHVVELINKEKNKFKFLYESKLPQLSKIQKKYLKKVEIGSYPFFRLGKIGVSLVLRSSNKSMMSLCSLDIKKIIKKKKIKVFKK